MFRKSYLILLTLVLFVLAACSPAPQATEAPAADVVEETMEDEAMDDEAMEDEAMDDEAMDDEAMDDEEMEDEAMADEEMADDTMADEEMMEDMAVTRFTIRIENISPAFDFTSSGVFNTPAGAADPGPLVPGAAYEFDFSAAPGSSLSFATMFVQSNDLFYAPGESGIALFDEDGSQVAGDITAEIGLWDAGTETNEAPGAGENQAPRQAGADTGEDEGGVVQPVNDGFEYPAVADHILVTLEALGGTEFTARIENISSDESLLLAPGVWVVHTEDAPLFTDGEDDRGEGLEALAEDGNPGGFAEALAERTGTVVVLAPGAYELNDHPLAFFAAGEADRGLGLEALAEDGNPGILVDTIDTMMADMAMGDDDSSEESMEDDMMGPMSFVAGVFNTPVGADAPGPVLPGGAYEFTLDAYNGQYLTFATMFVQSNDWFFSPDEMGIALFDADGNPISGDITDLIYLWNAGTEVDQAPGVGLDQAPRQSGPDTGEAEGGVVELTGWDTYGILITITPDQ